MALSYAVEAIVIKRIDYGEADRIVTLFTHEYGKKTVIAKGVRKLTSKRLGSLEVGTQLKASLIKRNGMDVLGQTTILNSFAKVKQDLTGMTQLYQLLEIVDILTREEELPEVYELLLSTLHQLECTNTRKPILLRTSQELLHVLGYIPDQNMDEYMLKQMIESVAERKLHSKDFLSLPLK